MINNKHLIKLLKQELEKTYKICWSCYDWKHEGLKPLICIIEDTKNNSNRRKWIKEKIRLLKKNI